MRRMRRTGVPEAIVGLLGLGCGPTVELDESSGEGTGTSTAASTSSESTAVTASGAIDESSSGTTGNELEDPSGPCPPPIEGITMVWCGAIDPWTIAVDDAWVYFDAEDESLWRVPLAGGDAEGLVGGVGAVYDLEVRDGVLYFASFFDGWVGSVPVEGGPMTVISDALFKPHSLVARGDHLLVAQYGDGLPLMRFDLASGQAEELYPGLDHAGHLLLDGENLWFATSINDGNIPTPIWRGTTLGGPLQLVIDPTNVVEDLVVDGSELWWTQYYDGNAVMRTELTDPPSTGTVVELVNHPFQLTLTPQRVYWREATGTDVEPHQQIIRSTTREGADSRLHVMTDLAGPVITTPTGIVSTIQQDTLGAVILIHVME